MPISKRHKDNGINRYFYITIQFLKDNVEDRTYIENPPEATICRKNDILVTRTGSTGKIVTNIEGCFHNNFFKVNYNKEKIDSRYLYYCLTSKEKQREMKLRSGITTIPDLNHFMFLDMKIPYFNIARQKKISKVLDAINNKIELNNQINQKLEAMAKTLYDYWFVQFDFPDANGKPYKSSGGKMVYSEELKREIPKGWEVKELGEISTIIAGGDKPKQFSDKKSKIFNIPIFSNGITNDGLYGYTDKARIIKQSITISARGTIGYCVLRNTPFVPIIRLISVTPNYDGEAEFFYHSIKNLVFENSGSVQQQLTVPQISTLKIIFPTTNILEKFRNIISPVTKKTVIIKKETQKLTQLRDWLLPMLMNGQVTVADAKEQIDELMVAEPGVGYGE